MAMKLFISYSRVDKKWVYEFWRKIQSEGHYPWIDRDIRPGVDWWDSICRNIYEAECFIFVMTPASVASIYCLEEMRFAIALNIPILPIMLGDKNKTTVPSEVNNNRIQYQEISDEMNLDRVLLKVEQGLGAIQVKVVQGDYIRREADVPNLPKPTQESEDVLETFTIGVEALDNNNLELATTLLEKVIELDSDGLGRRAKQRLKKVTDYNIIKALMQNPVTFEDALAMWQDFKNSYANYDPHNLDTAFSDLQKGNQFIAPPLPKTTKPRSTPESSDVSSRFGSTSSTKKDKKKKTRFRWKGIPTIIIYLIATGATTRWILNFESISNTISVYDDWLVVNPFWTQILAYGGGSIAIFIGFFMSFALAIFFTLELNTKTSNPIFFDLFYGVIAYVLSLIFFIILFIVFIPGLVLFNAGFATFIWIYAFMFVGFIFFATYVTLNKSYS